MFVNISGAVINIVLDAVFVLGFHWGMYGAAAATVIGHRNLPVYLLAVTFPIIFYVSPRLLCRP